MRAVLTTLGTMGDVVPMLALAQRLTARGHHIVFAAPPNYRAHALRLGVAFEPVGPEITTEQLRTAITAQRQHTNPAVHAAEFIRRVVPELPVMFESLRRLTDNADVLISTPYQPAARMVYDASGVPFVSIHLSPLGGTASPLHVREATRPGLNECRRQLGLSALADPIGADAASPLLAVHAVSRAVCRPHASWPSTHKVTGFFFLDEPMPDNPSLMRFVREGEPPIVVSFGSIVQDDTAAVVQLVSDAVVQAGRRAIFLLPWEEDRLSALQPRRPEATRLAGYVPHHELFPHAAAVVHHGGAGTTAATLRAAVPSIVVPHVLDQGIWGEYARVLGSALAVIPRAAWSSAQLARAMAALPPGPAVRARLDATAAIIREEPGAEGAASLIETLIGVRATRPMAPEGEQGSCPDQQAQWG